MKIQLTRLTNSILGSLADQTIITSNKAQYSVVKNHPLLLNLVTENSNFSSVFGRAAYSGLGASVDRADMMRDGSFSGMKTILLGNIKLPGFQYQQDAIDLYAIFQQCGLDINTFSYADQSTEMDKLITDLSTPANLAKLENLHLTPHFEAMKTAQTEFKAIYSQQLEANSNLRLVQSASSTRYNLEDALRNYFGVVQGMKSLAGWTELYAELNELVKSIRNSKMGARTEVTTEPAQ